MSFAILTIPMSIYSLSTLMLDKFGSFRALHDRGVLCLAKEMSLDRTWGGVGGTLLVPYMLPHAVTIY